MSSNPKEHALAHLRSLFGKVGKLTGSESMYIIGDDAARVYFRYSKIHPRGRTFYGLRQQDLRQLEGHASVICFLWDGQAMPLVIPFADYEGVFNTISPASDGQYKVQVIIQETETDLYIANAGRFNVEGNFGWSGLELLVDGSLLTNLPDLSHSQIQTLLGAIGAAKGFDIWIPASDRSSMDWLLASAFGIRSVPLSGFDAIMHVVQEVDVIWVQRGSSELRALFEVEHSTPIYSGLLRFNDVRLVAPAMSPRFTIVANDARREVFVRQLERPTFRASGLDRDCSFLDYRSVFTWHARVATRLA